MKFKFVSAIIVLLVAQFCCAENRIITLETIETDSKISFTPRLDFVISNQIKEAIDNGIRVDFIAKSEIYEKQAWWFDNTISQNKINLEVSFFTLSKLYMVKNKDTGKQLGFNKINQLANEFEKLIKLEIKATNNKEVWVKMRIRLDKASLPTAMQLPVLFDSDWDVNTPWYKQKVSN